MADPLSVAGSIAGLISLADSVFRLVFKYARSAVNAKKDVKNLADEIQALAGVLQSLRFLASGLEAEGHSFDPTLRTHHLGTLSSILSRLQQRAEKAHTKFENGSKTQQRLQQLKWPFSTGETKELLEDLHRHKSTISLALSADSLRKLQFCLAKQGEFSQTLSGIEDTVKRIEIHTQITLNDLKKKVLNFFMKVSPQPNFETSVKLRQPMTGLWLTGSPRFTTWLETLGSKLWLSGIPGAGKTVLAGAVIQDAITRSYSHPEVGVAFFFCDYKNPSTWNILNILGAMASQLSKQNDDAYSRLQTYYDQLHPAGRLDRNPDSEDLRAKITEMSEHFKQVIVIVDGLDECGDSTDNVVETLSDLANYTPNMSMALLSRHEVNIQGWLQDDFGHIPIAANSEDVRLYVGAEIEKRIQNRRLQITSVELKDEIMNKLVEGAKGMFRWVACQIDYLCDCVHDADRRKALSELPPNLPETYRRLLERVNKYPAKVKLLVQMCLQFIAFASPPLTIFQLQQAVSVPKTPDVRLDKSNLVSGEEIARRCSSLIRKSENGNIFEFSHFSVQEFLTDTDLLNCSALEGYYISESSGQKLLAIHCLRFLQLKDFERHPEPSGKEAEHISQRNFENPFYEYAAVMWPKFARSHFGDPVLFNSANSLFQRPKTVHFLAWSVEFLRHIHDVSHVNGIMWEFPCSPDCDAGKLESYVRGVTDDHFSPLHLAAALYMPEICKSLLDNKIDFNQKSAWGSPLELVTASLTAFCKTKQVEKYIHTFDYAWCMDLNLWSDIALDNRPATIELLVDAGAAVTNSSLQLNPNLLNSSFNLASLFLDLSATTKLMSLGVEPCPESPDNFRRCMYHWEICFDKDYLDRGRMSEQQKVIMEKTLRDFLNHLITTPIFTTDIGREIASIALMTTNSLPFSLAMDSRLIDSNPACAIDVLRAEAMRAVLNDDPEKLRHNLADGRLDMLGTFHPLLFHPEYCCSLLHIAAKGNFASACQILIDLGCDLNLPDSNGNHPIHLCCYHENTFTLDLLLQKGALHLATNSSGENLWHKCFYPSSDTILKRLIELDQDQTAEALLARTSSGETPLLMALNQNGDGDATAKVLLIINHCAGKPEFWKAHGPVFASAVEFGSEIVIERLLQAGVEPDPIENDNFTPLHQLSSNTTPECVQILTKLYPDADQLRFQGQTPLETYIENQLIQGYMVNQELLTVLATPDSLSSQNTDGETVWSFCCKEMSTNVVILILRNESTLELFNSVIPTLLRLGAMVSYEETKRQPGILPLFSALKLECGQERLHTTWISRETLSAVILESRYWEDARRSPAAIAFLKAAVKDGYLEAVKLSLEHGINVHQRLDQTSTMEFAVEKLSTAHESSAPKKADSEEILLALFLHAAAEEMKNYSPHGLGLGLLHLVGEAQHDGKAHTYWLVKKLIEWGVDINGEARFVPGYTPLVHLLSRGFFETAEILLDLGAKPSTNSAFDLVRASVYQNSLSFLKRLLRYSKETGTPVQWNPIFLYSLQFEGSSKNIHGATLFHYIASGGLNEILDFYIDEGLLGDVNGQTTDGYTAVHLAAIQGQAAVIHQLHVQGASLANQSYDGSTALHLAVRMENLSAVKVLLKLGAKSSPDAVAMTPRMYASALKNEEMIKLLDQHLPLDVEISSVADANSISRKRMKFLAQSLEDAITKDDLEECQRLHRVGCSLDTSMPSCHGCSPMLRAIHYERVRIVDWLLKTKATTLKACCDYHGSYSTIELAISFAIFNPILKRLLTQCVEQGGNIFGGDYCPLMFVIAGHNNEGLRVFLDLLKEMAESISYPLQLPSIKVTASVVNQRVCSIEYDCFETPLHVAANCGNIPAIDLLLDSGAIVDGCDSYYFTPLEYILSQGNANENHTNLDAAVRLVQVGAVTGIFLSWPPMLLFEHISSSVDLPKLLFEQTPVSCYNRTPPLLDRTTIVSLIDVRRDIVLRLQNFVPDLLEEDFGGRSFLHLAICCSWCSELPSRWNSALQKITPFPWHYDWPNFPEMVFLTSGFKFYRRQLPHDTFKRIMNLQPERGISPLCRASSRGIREIMENCLTMGAEIDFEGCSLGSALMIACACGRLDAVKLLVRRGAAISYVGKNGLTSAVIAARRSKTVLVWLLVGQFNEQRRLNYGDETSFASGKNREIRSWSGIGQAALRLIGRREMQPHESSFDYAVRLLVMRQKVKNITVLRNIGNDLGQENRN